MLGFILSLLKDCIFKKRQYKEMLKREILGPLLNEIEDNIAFLESPLIDEYHFRTFRIIKLNRPKVSAWSELIQKALYLELPRDLFESLKDLYRDLKVLDELICQVGEMPEVERKTIINEIEDLKKGLTERIKDIKERLYTFCRTKKICR